LEDTQRPRLMIDTYKIESGISLPRVFISAVSGEGLPELKALIADAVAGRLASRLNLEQLSPTPESIEDDIDVRFDGPANQAAATAVFLHDDQPAAA
jgi:hypothetical protein